MFIFIRILLVAIVFVAGISTGYIFAVHYKSNFIQAEAAEIDHALELYAKSTMRPEEGKTKFRYPQELSELGIVQKPQDVLTKILFWQPFYVDLSKYDYIPKVKSDGTMTYILGVVLPNGHYFTSPGSDLQ